MIQDLARIANITSVFQLSLNNMGQFAPLLKYKDLKSDQLSADVLKEVGAALGFEFNTTRERLDEVVSRLKADDIDGLMDMADNKSTLEFLKKAFTSWTSEDGGGDKNLLACPHCGEYINRPE